MFLHVQEMRSEIHPWKKGRYVFCPKDRRWVSIKKCGKGRCPFFVKRICDTVECRYKEEGR